MTSEKDREKFESYSFGEKVNLPDKEFNHYYEAFVESLALEHKWWVDGNNPSCSLCEKEISNAKNLRWYIENSYHPLCFRKAFAEDTKQNKQSSPLMKKYWSKVLSLEEK